MLEEANTRGRESHLAMAAATDLIFGLVDEATFGGDLTAAVQTGHGETGGVEHHIYWTATADQVMTAKGRKSKCDLN